MASDREYLDFILEQLSGLENVTWRAMMGEYVLYWRGRIFGGIYDNRFLVKPTESAAAMMPDADRELPYEGAKEMLLVDNVDDRDFLEQLVTAMYGEITCPGNPVSGFFFRCRPRTPCIRDRIHSPASLPGGRRSGSVRPSWDITLL